MVELLLQGFLEGFLAFHPAETAKRQGGDAPIGSAPLEAGETGTHSDGEYFHVDPDGARGEKVAELMDDDDEGKAEKAEDDSQHSNSETASFARRRALASWSKILPTSGTGKAQSPSSARATMDAICVKRKRPSSNACTAISSAAL